jgi:hypothetical protein
MISVRIGGLLIAIIDGVVARVKAHPKSYLRMEV